MDRPIGQQSVDLVLDRIRLAIDNLPVLSEKDVPMEDTCPICLIPFAFILQNEPKLDVTLAVDTQRGVTKLPGCGHVFCRNDLAEWIRNMHGSCPTCRHSFLDVRPVSESSEGESSDGDFAPGSLDDDDDDDEDDEYDEYVGEGPPDFLDLGDDLGDDFEELENEFWNAVAEEEMEDMDVDLDLDLDAFPVGDPDDIELELEMLFGAGATSTHDSGEELTATVEEPDEESDVTVDSDGK